MDLLNFNRQGIHSLASIFFHNRQAKLRIKSIIKKWGDQERGREGEDTIKFLIHFSTFRVSLSPSLPLSHSFDKLLVFD